MRHCSKRMEGLVSLVPPSNCVADVGCDHGYVGIALVEEEIAKKVIASDVRKGPLQRAKENIALAHLEDKIETRLSDGLKNIQPKEVDTILISGMGGGLIQKILQQSMEVVQHATTLVLQPQSEWLQLREFLQQCGFGVVEEKMIEEEGKVYPMFSVTTKPKQKENYSFVQLQYGPKLLEEHNPVLYEYLQKQKQQKQQVLEKIQAQGNRTGEKTIQRMHKMQQEIDLICQGLAYWEKI